MSANYIQPVLELAIEAGRRIMPFYRGHAAVTVKQDASPLTAADLAAHHFLVDSLPRVLPGVEVISEESLPEVHLSAVNLDRFWLVDPLDGTKEFIKATGEFTVNIALIEKGRPILGVVHAPAMDVTYYASDAGNAFRVDAKSAPVRLSTRRANPTRLAVVASTNHAGPMVKAMLDRLSNPVLRSMGSSLKFCLVAEGTADLYLRDVPTMEWDTAAAQCVVESAGGSVCSLDGKPLRYGKAGLKNPSLMTAGDRDFPWQQFTCGDATGG
ncbi:MAG TPA: 3'(2'),5'-bisphosphate nucleotidase CysQ [Verrucomicrobiae bacterium]|jgi:3'(2'), 5'-bisphosphate nucleotidase|nr:3'(2'),5'-bisphosphate nucleotidase CysQ [Verrucomicrobiae bacterium]